MVEGKGKVDENGKGCIYRGIPFYQEKLDEFAKGFAEGINEVHKNGCGYKKDDKEIAFFVDGEGNETDIKAINIAISDKILEDVGNIAVAKDDGNDVEDNRNMLAILALRENKNFFKDGMSKGTPDDFIKSMLSNLAVDSMQAQRMDSTQKLIIKNIEKRRQSESGVYQDEEMTNLVKFQHSYTASARMITTLDQILDVTINRLGLVGR